MSAMAKLGQRISTRYLWAKLNAARDVVLNELATPGSSQPSSGVLQMFQEAFNKPLTSVIAVAGAAMAPAINPESLKNPAAFEKLVVRLIPRPSSRTVAVGDVVAFNSPLDPTNNHSLLVRRVAALEGHAMYTTDDASHIERVPPGHCWLLADNEQLSPPDVIDSRAFGYLDIRLIKGRVIYRLQSKEHHGPVANSPGAEPCDAAVVDSEVDVEALAAGMPSEQ